MRYLNKRWDVKCIKCSSTKVELKRLERKEDKSNLRKYKCVNCNNIFQVHDFIVYSNGIPSICREYWK